MTSLFQPLHGGRGGAATVVTFKLWSREQDTLVWVWVLATPELTVAVAATHNPLTLGPTSTDNNHPKLQNWVKNTFIYFIYGRGVPVNITVAS